MDVGLGIGIDFGPVRLVQVAGGLTVVGAPVVYACRLSAAPAGLTLLNQPAYDMVSENFGGLCFTTETTLDIKHEGRMLAYEVRTSGRGHGFVAAKPDWLIESERGSGEQSSDEPHTREPSKPRQELP
jgi:class 3 adenylate cyclase